MLSLIKDCNKLSILIRQYHHQYQHQHQQQQRGRRGYQMMLYSSRILCYPMIMTNRSNTYQIINKVGINIVLRKNNICFIYRSYSQSSSDDNNYDDDDNNNINYHNTIRKGFGSFHSEDIESLINQSIEEIEKKLPSIINNNQQCIQNYCQTELYNINYGIEIRKKLYNIDNKYNFLNHGAFGCTLLPILEESNKWHYYIDKQPLKFFDRELFLLIIYSIKKVANFLNCQSNELYPIQNVTTGINIICSSLELNKNDEIICFNLTYGSTKKILKYVCQKFQSKLHIIEINLPIITSKTEIIELFLKYLNKNTKLVIIDHITSNTGIILPILELSYYSKLVGALVIIDAAHSLMALPIDIYAKQSIDIHHDYHHNHHHDANIQQQQKQHHHHSDTVVDNDMNDKLNNHSSSMKNIIYSSTSTTTTSTTTSTTTTSIAISDVADVWITNGHKWFSAPKGCAIMWVKPNIAVNLQPLVISHGYHLYEDNNNSNNNDSSSSSTVNNNNYNSSSGNVIDNHGNDICNSSSSNRNSYSSSSRTRVNWWHQNRYPIKENKFLSGVVWNGCRDYTAFLCIPSVLQLWQSMPSYKNATGIHVCYTIPIMLCYTDYTTLYLYFNILHYTLQYYTTML